eukprot:scaffold8110_cov267-Pinguiococcus_pyrenoidosus.AAC.4
MDHSHFKWIPSGDRQAWDWVNSAAIPRAIPHSAEHSSSSCSEGIKSTRPRNRSRPMGMWESVTVRETLLIRSTLCQQGLPAPSTTASGQMRRHLWRTTLSHFGSSQHKSLRSPPIAPYLGAGSHPPEPRVSGASAKPKAAS